MKGGIMNEESYLCQMAGEAMERGDRLIRYGTSEADYRRGLRLKLWASDVLASL
jgi:hypothetical protein